MADQVMAQRGECALYIGTACTGEIEGDNGVSKPKWTAADIIKTATKCGRLE